MIKKTAVDTKRISRRMSVLLAVLASLFVAVAVKAFKVQVNQTRFYQREANKRQIRTETIPVSRGVIYDSWKILTGSTSWQKNWTWTRTS